MTGAEQRDPLIEQFAVPLASALRTGRDFWCEQIEREARRAFVGRAFVARRLRDTGSLPDRAETDAFVARLRERAEELR